MPLFAAAAIPFTMSAIGGTAAAGASIYGAKKESDATNKALAYESDSTTKALDAQREQQEWERRKIEEQRQLDLQKFEEDRRRYEAETAYRRDQDLARLGLERDRFAWDKSRYEDTTNYNREQFADYLQRMQPYTDAGTGAVNRLSDLISRPGYVPAVRN